MPQFMKRPVMAGTMGKSGWFVKGFTALADPEVNAISSDFNASRLVFAH
jgi:hypothetical protein